MLWLRLLYIANGVSFGVFSAFTSVLLQSRGFDATLIGLSGSLGAFAYMFALPAWGHLGDKVVGSRRALQLAVIPAAVFALLYNAPVSAAVLIAITVGFGIAGGPLGALTDAMAVSALPDPTRQYGSIRLLTSLGVAASSFVTGLVCDSTGYWITPYLFAASALVVFVSVQFVPMGRESDRSRRAAVAADVDPAEAAVGTIAAPGAQPRVAGTPALAGPSSGRFGSVSEALSGRPRIYAILTSVLLLFFGVMCSVTFLGLRLSDLGGGASSIGISYGISGIAEVCGLVFATAVATRLGLRTLVAISAAGFVGCCVLWAVLVDPWLIVISRAGGGFFFSGLAVSFVLTMSAILPGNLQATGQTLYAASAFGAAAVIANLVGGIVYDAAGSSAVFATAAVLGVLGGLIGVLAVPSTRVRRASIGPTAAADGPGTEQTDQVDRAEPAEQPEPAEQAEPAEPRVAAVVRR